jgi:hypothetical protein
MFTQDQIIYYISDDFKINKGTYKGYVRNTSSFPPTIINVIDYELNENLLIIEDYVFNTYKEAEAFLNED